MLNFAIHLSLWMLAASILLTTARLVCGPDAVNRVLALDALSINAIALILILGITRQSTLYFEASLILAMMGFVGTVALSKYLMARAS